MLKLSITETQAFGVCAIKLLAVIFTGRQWLQNSTKMVKGKRRGVLLFGLKI
jgi:hypothetical protein